MHELHIITILRYSNANNSTYLEIVKHTMVPSSHEPKQDTYHTHTMYVVGDASYRIINAVANIKVKKTYKPCRNKTVSLHIDVANTSNDRSASSVFPNRLEVKILPTFRPTHTPPLPLITASRPRPRATQWTR